MKYKLRKKLYDYRVVILDMDGTLYYQLPVRICMAFELLAYYLIHIRGMRELFALRRFRKDREMGVLTESNPVAEYWMEEKPLRYIYLFRDKKLLRLIQTLGERGAKIAVYSDLPVERKIRALRDLAADYHFCADDAAIRCLKPNSAGLVNIMGVIGEAVESMVFIGDRSEKDGKCAEGVGMDYIILDKNPIMRHKHLKELLSYD